MSFEIRELGGDETGVAAAALLALRPHFGDVEALAARGRGAGAALMEWLIARARDEGCAELHLDSGVGPERESAHRLYFGSRLRIASYHFTRVL